MDKKKKTARGRAVRAANENSERKPVIEAKRKARAKTGKAKRPETPTATANALTIRGQLPSIQSLRAGPHGGNSGEEEWPSVLCFDSGQLAGAGALAQLSVHLWSLKRHEDQKKWEEEKTLLGNCPSRGKKEQKAFNQAWNEKLREGERFLTPAGYLDEALALLEQARAKIMRPQSIGEYLLNHLRDEEAHTRAIAHSSQSRRVPFKKIFDPIKHDGAEETITIPMQDGPDRTFVWRVFASEKGFNNCFWGYANSQSRKWREKEGRREFGPIREWVHGRKVPKGFPPLTEKLYGTEQKRREAAEKWIPSGNLLGFPDRAWEAYDSEQKRRAEAEKWIKGETVPEGLPPFSREESIQRRAEFAREKWDIDFLSRTLEEALIDYNRSCWTSYLRDWVRDGIPWERLLDLDNYRRRSNPKRWKNLKGKRGPGRTGKAEETAEV